MSDMPADPFGPPEELLTMMKGYGQLYSAALMSGFSEGAAAQFIACVFVMMMQNAQPPAQEGSREEKE